MKSSWYFATAILVGLLICSATAYSQDFGPVAVGTSKADTITVTVAKAGTAGSLSVRFLGAENLDFTDAGGGTCAAGATYAAGATCTVNVTFSPKAAGWRSGAVVLFDGAGGTGTILASTPILGTGMGAQIAFNTARAIAIKPKVNGIGLSFPAGVAVDGAGNLFISDKYNARLIKVPAGGGAPTLALNNGDSTSGSILDGAGDIYVALVDNGRVVKVPVGGGPPVDISIAGVIPVSVALDAAGDLFVADALFGQVIEVPANGGGNIQLAQVVAGIPLRCNGVASDRDGNVLIADSGNSRLIKFPAGGGTPVVLNPVADGKGLNAPNYIVLDGAGNWFVADAGNNRIVVLPADGSTPLAMDPVVDGVGLALPYALALDSAGNLFIADAHNNRVVEMFRGSGPSMTFADTQVGSLSTDSPQAVQVQNAGNQALSFSVINFPADFSPGSGSGECTVSAGLAAGQSCVVSISFAPSAAGALSENVTLTDDDRNLTAATQLISVAGLGKPGLKVQTITFAPLPNVDYGSGPIALTATASSGLPVSYTVTGPASVSSNMLTPTGIGLVTVTASQPGNDVYSAAPSATQSFLVQASSTTALRVVWPQVTVGAPASFRVLVQGIGGLPTGTVTFYADGNSLGQATLAAGTAVFTTSSLPAGSHRITAVYGGDQAHVGSASSAFPELIVTTPTMQLTAAPNPLPAEGSTTVSATIEHVSGSPVPTGKIKFYLNGTGLGTVPAVAGAATWTLQTLDPGTYQVAAQFTGTGGSQSIQGSSMVVTVEKAPTIITLGLSDWAPPAGTPVTLYGAVHEVLPGKIPGGTASFYVDGQCVGTVPLVNGTASYPIPGLGTGWHTIAVQYNGDQNYFVPPSERSQNWVQFRVF